MNNSLAQALVARAAAARKRLTALEGRIDEGDGASRVTLKLALRELGDVLEELHVASEQLYAASDDLAAARRDAVAHAERYRELHEGLPVPCILTNPEGCVDEANGHAATLLNVAGRYLVGKPMLLFMPERDQYFRMLETGPRGRHRRGPRHAAPARSQAAPGDGRRHRALEPVAVVLGLVGRILTPRAPRQMDLDSRIRSGSPARRTARHSRDLTESTAAGSGISGASA